MLAGLLGGKGLGKGAGVSQGSVPEGNPSANQAGCAHGGLPLEAMLAGLLGGKGLGKGAGVSQGSVPEGNPSANPAGCAHGGVPLEAMLAGLLGGKGLGKGAAGFPQGGVPEVNPDANRAGFPEGGCPFAPGAGACGQGGQMPNPVQTVLGALLAAKGAGKGKGCCPFGMTAPNNPVPEPQAPEPQAPVSEADSASRTQFEESVSDLVNMGLVSDPQVARELLTKHGDVSTVVSILTEG